MSPYSRPGASQAHVLTCRDGKRIALHMSTPLKFWESLVKATSHPELFDDPRFAERGERIRNHAEVIRVLDGYFKEHDRAEWCRRLEWYDVPHSPVYDASEALETEQARHLGLKVQAAGVDDVPFMTVRNPVVYDREQPTHLRRPPLLDEHRSEVLHSIKRQETT